MSTKLKRLIVLSFSIIAAAILFIYLSETLILWRLFFSFMMFISTYILFDGFIKYW